MLNAHPTTSAPSHGPPGEIVGSIDPRPRSPREGAIGSLLGTLRRKIARSLADRGVRATLRRLVAFPIGRVASALRETTPERRRYRREERAFDRRFGIDTRRGRDPGWMARIPGVNWRHGRGYAPAPFRDVSAALDGLGADPARFVFVDVGAGKGRAMLLAADRPFRRVVGVEYAPRLCEIAAENLTRYRSQRPGGPELSIVEADAVEWAFPLEPLVVFFHHPFDEPVFRVVLENLERSLAELPRPVIVIYLDPQCGNLFDDSPWFRRRPPEPGVRLTETVAVFDFVGGVTPSIDFP